ncbi:cell division protein FtsQ/DivIB [Paenibacillus roseipurpureus]|uniref:FtsQ-type POTRA domain-containing protein n=1 Tax=Paenibacillus roseopurpureus TaxID=2918901 RepID=A0AA96RM77_9BACL|nr:FtsQ-type POTRA domain-containing protein [Paenibacillus sp. MBLB1832]WNR46445.1 FtsQ-type POTRA domain-containing protein [Paenibacillus sp. MBLB1832]
MSEDQKVPALQPVPKPRSRTNRKLLVLLLLFFMTVLIILFFQSSLSKISQVEIEGNELLAPDTVGQASQLKVGDRFFAVSSSTIGNRIAALPMVKHVEVKKSFPGVIRIHVEEYPKVAFQVDAQGKKYAILADASFIALPAGSSIPLDMPILSGWNDQDPNKLALCKALDTIPKSALSDISEIKPDPSESYPDKIKLYTRSQYEVFTTISYLPDKIDNLPGYIASLQENHIMSGAITMLEAEYHTPFGSNAVSKADSKGDPKSTPKVTPKP